ncbi:MAG TPA: hypothetical protein VGR31_04970 [Planctomycetota bacterium]|nr:hypothetical protein [Planctomycetota bacterium]
MHRSLAGAILALPREATLRTRVPDQLKDLDFAFAHGALIGGSMHGNRGLPQRRGIVQFLDGACDSVHVLGRKF